MSSIDLDDLCRNQDVLSAYLQRFEEERRPDVIRLTILYALQAMKARVDLDSIDWSMLQRLCRRFAASVHLHASDRAPEQADHREHELHDSITRLESSLREVRKELSELRESMVKSPRPNKRLDVYVLMQNLCAPRT